MAQYKLIHCNINGKDVEKMVDVRASLTDMLRNDYHLTSVKKGCEVGECGACNVLIDGECFNSCIYLAVWAEGKHIRTLEGLLGPGGELSDIQQAFMEEMAKVIPLGEGRVRIIEIPITENDPAAQKQVWEINLPKEVIIGCILRQNQTLIPRGDTRILGGDVLVLISGNEQEEIALLELKGGGSKWRG